MMLNRIRKFFTKSKSREPDIMNNINKDMIILQLLTIFEDVKWRHAHVDKCDRLRWLVDYNEKQKIHKLITLVDDSKVVVLDRMMRISRIEESDIPNVMKVIGYTTITIGAYCDTYRYYILSELVNVTKSELRSRNDVKYINTSRVLNKLIK